MKNNYLISVIIPIYNSAAFLNRCLDSVISQTYTNLEILLVNDGSTDNSLEICKKYAEKDNRIRVIEQKNMGAAVARNNGIKNSKGQYIGFVDSDDFVEPNMYEILIKNILDHNADISICGRFIEENNKILYVSNDCVGKEFSNYDALVELNSLKSFDMSPCDKLYKKETITDIFFPDGKNSEDFYFMYQVMFKASKVYYSSKPLYHYCRRENSHSNYSVNDSYLEASKSQVEFFKQNCPQLLYVANCYDAYANTIQYNKYIVNGVDCPKEVVIKLKKNVKNNMKFVKMNKNFPWLKKVQMIIFLYFTPLYKIIIKRMNRV